MDDPEVPQKPVNAPASKRRRALPTSLVVLASILAFVAILAIWANRQFLNTENWTATSSSLLEEPVIRTQVATFLVDELYAQVDIQQQIEDALPPRAKPLAGPAAGALRDQVEKRANAVLARPRFQERWEDANRTAHASLVRMLEGGGPLVSTEGGVVVLDLKALLLQMQEQVGLGGRAAGALPEGAASITLFRSDQLEAAQDGLKLLKALPIVLLGLSFALFGIAVAVAGAWRRQVVLAYGIGLVAAGLGALAAASVAGGGVVDSLSRTAAAEPAVAAAWDIGTTRLDEAASAAVGYGVVMILGAWLAGPMGWAVAVRRALAPYLREPLIAYGALAVVMAIVIFWWKPTPATRDPVLALLLVVFVALGWEALRRKTAREFPDASRVASMQRAKERIGKAFGSVRAGTSDGAAALVRQAGGLRPRGDPGLPAPEELRMQQLERLGRLRDAGVLDDDELRAEKARILG